MKKLRERFEWKRAPESTDNSEKGFKSQIGYSDVTSPVLLTMLLMANIRHQHWFTRLIVLNRDLKFDYWQFQKFHPNLQLIYTPVVNTTDLWIILRSKSSVMI